MIADTRNGVKGRHENEPAEGGPRRSGNAREAPQRGDSLAADPLFADLQPPHLRRADAHLADAVAALEDRVDAAVAAEEKASACSARSSLASPTGGADRAKNRRVRIPALQGDQAKNRGATDLAEASARLGDAGIALRKDLIRATGSMQSAEQVWQNRGQPAAEDQSATLDIWPRPRIRRLDRATARRAPHRAPVPHHRRADRDARDPESIRETTQAQAPRVSQKSRTALIGGGLSKKEAELGDGPSTCSRGEETEFGIALPTTLRVLSREMRRVQGWLKAGDVAARTVGLEKRIEEDLLSLLEAVRRLPPTTPPAPGTPLPADLRDASASSTGWSPSSR